MIDIYLYGDERGLSAPRSYTVQYWDGGAWNDAAVRDRLPPAPAAWAMNRVRIEPVETESIRVVFEHDLPLYTGVTEIVVWK